jgi:hypothetical protein
MKAFTLYFMLAFVPLSLLAQDRAIFRIREGESGFYWKQEYNAYHKLGFESELPKDAVLYGNDFYGDAYLVLSYDNNEIYMPPYEVESIHKEGEFASSILSDHDPEHSIWVPYYYLETLSTGNRDIIYQNEKEIYAGIVGFDPGKEHWSKYFQLRRALTLYQHGLLMDGYCLFIDQIKKTGKGYTLTVIRPVLSNDTHTLSKEVMVYKLQGIDREQFFALELIIDGDYMEIKENNITVAKIVLVTQNFCGTISDLVRGYALDEMGPHDLKDTDWPRRADGSMDYPPPLDMSNYKQTHRVQDNLRLRDTELPKQETANSQTVSSETVQEVVTVSWGKKPPFFLIVGGITVILIGGIVAFLIIRKRGV